MFTKTMIAVTVAITGAVTAAGAVAYHQFGCPMQYLNCCHSRQDVSTETTPTQPETTTPKC
jgi:hypothetical protein